MIDKFIRSNFDRIIETQEGFDHDIAMVNAVKFKTLNNDMVKKWMRDYGLFQGIESADRLKIADEFIRYVQDANEDTELDIESRFHDLHTRLYNVHKRKWLSATSKLLWCVHPNQIVIYDAFVERVISVLQCLDEELAKSPRLNYAPNVKSEKDLQFVTKHYMNYQNLVKVLASKYQTVINELKKESQTNYNYDLRIIDKALWLMGDMKSEFKLGQVHCKIG